MRLAKFIQWRWRTEALSPRGPLDLAVVRVLVLAGVASYYQRWFSLPAWGEVSDALWMPISFFRWLRLGPLSTDTLRGIELAWYSSMACGALGLLTRFTIPLAALTSLIFLGYEGNFGKPYHHANLFVFVVFLLAASRCADRLSVDEWLSRRRGSLRAADSAAYAWPLAVGRLLFLLFYFEAGLHKLLVSGSSWALSRNVELSIRLAQAGTADTLLRHPTLVHAAAVVVLVLEIGCILCLAVPRLAWFFVPGLFLMQLSFHYLMEEHFVPLLFCYALWVPWSRWLDGPAAAPAAKEKTRPAAQVHPPAVAVTALALFLVSMLQLATRRDDWPFSSFPMYASVAAGPLVQDQVFMTDDTNGRVRAVRLQLQPFDDHRLSVALSRLAKEDPRALKRALDDVLRRHRQSAPLNARYSAVEFRRLIWKDVDSADLSRPDQELLLARSKRPAAGAP